MGIDAAGLRAEVVVTTYNSPHFLDLVLAALSKQSITNFEVCIADDGSGQETADIIQYWARSQFKKRIRHEWHPDNGFQKNIILNKTIASSQADYLVFIDGDCLAPPRFLERHLSLAETGRFISGGVLRLPLSANRLITAQLIEEGTIFDRQWLHAHGDTNTFAKQLKAGMINSTLSSILEIITPVKRTWNGGNASGWRNDLLIVNGFNEDMRYGAEDVELGVRLQNAGINARHCRYTAPLLHMEHSRGYADPITIQNNKIHVKNIKRNGDTWTKNGIKKDQP